MEMVKTESYLKNYCAHNRRIQTEAGRHPRLRCATLSMRKNED